MGLGLDDGSIDIIVLHDGTTLQTHGAGACFGEHCCIHKPSDHPLRNAPLSWARELRMMFRVCEHETVHPDPDSLEFRQAVALFGGADWYDGWHPCCPKRCCE